MDKNDDDLSFDRVFDIIGGFGTFQKCLFGLLCLSPFLNVESLYIIFIGYQNEHWCHINQLQQLPHELQRYISSPIIGADSSGDVTYDRCHMFDFNYSSYTEAEYLRWDREVMVSNTTPTSKCGGWEYDRSIFSRTIVSDYNLVCGDYWLVNLVSVFEMSGSLLGSLLCGVLSDNYGRKKAFAGLVSVKIFGNGITLAAREYWLLVVGKFITGLGTIGCYIVPFVMMIEMVGPQQRGYLGALYSIAFSCGYIMVAVYSYFIRDYTILFIIMAVPNLVLFLVILVIPESPRWLLTKGRLKEAKEIIVKIANINGKTVPKTFDMKPINIERKTYKNCCVLLTSKYIRKYTWVFFFVWFTVNLVYYGLSLMAGSLAGDVFLNTVLLGIVEIPANILCMVLMETKMLGRKKTNAFALLLAGGACIISLPLLILYDQSTGTTVLAIIGKSGITATFNGIYVYTSEVFPTEVRNLGMGVTGMVAKASGIFAPVVGGILMTVWTPLPFMLFGVTCTLSAFLILIFLPETLHVLLPETIKQIADTFKRNGVRPINEDVIQVGTSNI